MPRVKRGVTARARHKKVLEQAKGFRGRRGNVFRIAKEAVMKAGQYAYRDRRAKKRVFRQLWIARINAAARELGLTYSQFANGIQQSGSLYSGTLGLAGNLDQVHALVAGHIQRLAQRQYAQLPAVTRNNPHFAGTYFAIYPDKRTRRRRSDRGVRAEATSRRL